MPQFSLLNIFFATAGLAAGFAIWRLPEGGWTDVPIYFLAACFAVGFVRRAVDLIRSLAARRASAHSERRQAQFQATVWLLLAIVIFGCWGLRYLAAAGLLLKPDEPLGLGFLATDKLPNDLVVLTMLAAVLVASCGTPPQIVPRRRQRIYAAVGVLATAIAAIVYWVDRMLIPYLIYLAANGISRAQPARLLPPERNVRDAVWQRQFVAVSLLGTMLVAYCLVFIWVFARSWNTIRWKWMLLAIFALSLVTLGACVLCLSGTALSHLSPEMAEAIRLPSGDILAVATAIPFVSASVIAWRMSAVTASEDGLRTICPRYFHETWIAPLLLALLAPVVMIGAVINELIKAWPYRFSRGINWQLIAYVFLNQPGRLIYLAAMLGGFALAWQRYRNRSEPAMETLPHIQPTKFCYLALSLTAVLMLSAPFLAALAFSFWLTF